MFDEALCASFRVHLQPYVSMEALAELRWLLGIVIETAPGSMHDGVVLDKGDAHGQEKVRRPANRTGAPVQ